MQQILSGSVLWCTRQEVLQRNRGADWTFHFSGMRPFHTNWGEIALTDKSVQITGTVNLAIQFADLTQLYLGFDDAYTPMLARNFGLFWKPLRLTLLDDSQVYLIIDYKFFGSSNAGWFAKLKEVLS
ncbi:MAG: hypothetical protein EOO51_08230 [Flavobacterium sp.]|nr:MAG: hypothetical protein EOO51_08230 [Flavobacterium sp.]